MQQYVENVSVGDTKIEIALWLLPIMIRHKFKDAMVRNFSTADCHV